MGELPARRGDKIVYSDGCVVMLTSDPWNEYETWVAHGLVIESGKDPYYKKGDIDEFYVSTRAGKQNIVRSELGRLIYG